MLETKLQIIEDLISFLKEIEEDKDLYRTQKGAFSRQRRLPLSRVVGLLINLPRKSLDLELAELFSCLDLGESVSKSAFSQARYKLDEAFFEDWTSELTMSYYLHSESEIKRWNDFLLFGVDGSTLHLFEDREGALAEHFGKYEGAVTARVMCLYDVLNQISYKSALAPIKTSENSIARDWLELLGAHKTFLGEILCLYDMKFRGFAFAYLHDKQGINYVMRTEKIFNIPVYDFARSSDRQRIVKWSASQRGLEELREKGYVLEENESIEVRLIKVDLPDGETEYLITSLLDTEAYPIEQFGELYFKRWGSETNFDVWKNKMQIENFSGHGVRAVYQDFHATVFTANIHSLFVQECEEDLEQINRRRELNYNINRNLSLGFLKGRIVRLFLSKNKMETACNIKQLFLKKLEPKRPGRKLPRNKRVIHLNGKYATLTNYRRAL